MNADGPAFEVIYEQTGLKTAFREPFVAAVQPRLADLRDLLNLENESSSVRYKDFDWRLSMVTACRQHQKIMQPKFTARLDLQQLQAQERPDGLPGVQKVIQHQSCIFDLDYTMMKRLQEELQDAVKSVE